MQQNYYRLCCCFFCTIQYFNFVFVRWIGTFLLSSSSSLFVDRVCVWSVYAQHARVPSFDSSDDSWVEYNFAILVAIKWTRYDQNEANRNGKAQKNEIEVQSCGILQLPVNKPDYGERWKSNIRFFVAIFHCMRQTQFVPLTFLKLPCVRHTLVQCEKNTARVYFLCVIDKLYTNMNTILLQ